MKPNVRVLAPGENELWLRLGCACNADRAEFQPGRIVFPPIDALAPGRDVVRLAAEVGGEPVGRALTVTSARGSVRLFEISVLPSMRRQGIGSALLREAEALARAAGDRYLGMPYYLDENSALREFFRANGYFEKECYSVIIDLTRTPPQAARDKVARLLADGVRLRSLSAADADMALLTALHETYFPGWPEGMLPAPWDMRRSLQHQAANAATVMLLAEQEGVTAGFVVGCCGCTTVDTRFAPQPGEGLLSSIAVTENFRRRGVGTFLCMGLMDVLREHGDAAMCYGGVRPGHGSMKLAQGAGGEEIRKHYAMAREVAAQSC